jgi:predicted acylesterase/phospholipase RssA
MIAYAFQSGGAKGAFQAGCLKSCKAYGIEPQLCSGVSVGALNTLGMVTMGQSKVIDMWDELDGGIVKKHYLRAILGFKQGFYGTKGLKKLLDGLPYPAPKHQHALGVAGYIDGITGTYRYSWSDKNWDTFLRDVFASASMPLIMDPVIEKDKDGKLSFFGVDGGTVEMTPLKPLIDAGATEIYVFLTRPVREDTFEETEERKKSLKKAHAVTIGLEALEIALHHNFMRDIKVALEVNRAVGLGADKKHKYIDFTIFEPAYALGETLDFNKKALKWMIDHGDEVADGVLGDD